MNDEMPESYITHGLSESQWRYLFAGMAMSGLTSRLTVSRDTLMKFTAETAVQYADALLEELKKVKND